jgi:hypothetical protein
MVRAGLSTLSKQRTRSHDAKRGKDMGRAGGGGGRVYKCVREEKSTCLLEYAPVLDVDLDDHDAALEMQCLPSQR